MQFKLFLLGAAVLPFITAAPVETGNDIAVRAETQDVSITVRKAEAEAAPEESGKK